MFKAILYKEFIKIKYVYLILLTFLILLLLILYLDIIKSFFAIEPHSMLWYKAVFLDNLYFDKLKYFPSFCALIIALAQFLPEVHKKKFRIPLHLPLSQNKLILYYLGFGFFLLSFINILFLISLYFISNTYYNALISHSAIITTFPWIISSYIIYNSCVAIMIEPFLKRKVFLIFIFIALVSLLFLNTNYEAYSNVLYFYLLILVLSFTIPMLSVDRFKNSNISFFSNQKILSKIANYSLLLFFIFVFSFYLPKLYKDLVQNNSLATYVFYSSTQKNFVYKKHYGEHVFTYGNSDEKSLSKEEFEEALPLVYWKNLDIQKKLPLIINGKSYDKNSIKKARQSFRFDYRDLDTKQIQLYPLFNPNSSIGTIAFPNVMFNIQDRFNVFDSEENTLDEKLSLKYTNIFKKNGFLFPAKIIAGKTTNIKPLDEGYFIQDSKNDLFHMKVYDDEMFLKEITYNKEIHIQAIKISESRKKEFYGLAIDYDNQVYIISYDNYKFIRVNLPNYDASSMKLELYANVINKIIRYKNKKEIYTLAYDKDFNYIASFKTGVPQINPIYEEIYNYLFLFIIEKDRFKKEEQYLIKLGSAKALLSYFFFLLIFLTYKKISTKKN